MQRGWWKGVVALVVSIGLFAQHLEVSRAETFIEIGTAFDSTPCLTGDPLYDPVGDVCAALNRWEDAAVQTVRELRGITGGTDAQVRFAAKADIRAEVLARMLSAIKKAAADRTTDEQTVVTWLQNVQKRQNIAVAEQAFTEFKAYDGEVANNAEGPGWCTYTPPAPYENDRPDWSPCGPGRNPLEIFTLPPTYPDAATWVKWGAAREKADKFTLAGVTSSTELSAAAIAGISAAAIGIAAGSIVAGLTGALGATFIGAITPFALFAFQAFINGALVTVTSTAQALAAATATMFGAAAFIVVVVAVALYGIIYSFLQTFARDGIRTELENGVANARAAALPDLAAYIATTDGMGQTYDLIATYLTNTDEFGRATAAPARGATELLFERDSVKSVTTTVQTWDGTSATLELRGGLLVLDGIASTGAKVLDREGNKVTMFRAKTSGGQWGFVLVPADTSSNSCITATTVTCATSIEATILDGAGENDPLRVVSDELPDLKINADARRNDASTFDLSGFANWHGQSLSNTITWWQPAPTNPVFNVSGVCLGLDVELVEGVCYSKFATGSTATVTVTSSAPVRIRAVVTSPSGLTATAFETIQGPTSAPVLTVTPPTGPVDEGSIWTMQGQIVDTSGPNEVLTVTIDWNDGTAPVVKTIPAPGSGVVQFSDFTFTRSGTTTTFTLNRTLFDETSGTVSITVSDGSATDSATATYAARNVAPTVNSISIDGCDGVLQCILTPGQTVTVRGTISDIGNLDTATATVAVTGVAAVPATLTQRSGLVLNINGNPAQPKVYDYVATLTLPVTGNPSTTVTVSTLDNDGGAGSRTAVYGQYTPPAPPASVSALLNSSTSIAVYFTPDPTAIELLPVTWVAECVVVGGVAPITRTGTASPIIVPIVVRNRSYSCRAFARTAAGDSSALTAVDVFVPGPTPTIPSGVTATPDGTGRLSVEFVSSLSSLPITYTATCVSPTGSTGTADGSASPIVVTGLTPGATYTCTVVAVTSNASSAASSPSDPVVVAAAVPPTTTTTVPETTTTVPATTTTLPSTTTTTVPATTTTVAATTTTVPATTTTLPSTTTTTVPATTTTVPATTTTTVPATTTTTVPATTTVAATTTTVPATTTTLPSTTTTTVPATTTTVAATTTTLPSTTTTLPSTTTTTVAATTTTTVAATTTTLPSTTTTMPSSTTSTAAPSTTTGGAAAGTFPVTCSMTTPAQPVTCPAPAGMNGATALTWSAWVRLDSTTGTQTFVSRAASPWGDQAIRIGAFSGWLYAEVTTANGAAQLLGGGRLSTGVWTHLTATYDGATLRFYVNGVLVGSRAATGALRADLVNAPIVAGGAIASPGGQPGTVTQGLVAPAVIGDRVLGLQEIAALFAAGPPWGSSSGSSPTTTVSSGSPTTTTPPPTTTTGSGSPTTTTAPPTTTTGSSAPTTTTPPSTTTAAGGSGTIVAASMATPGVAQRVPSPAALDAARTLSVSVWVRVDETTGHQAYVSRAASPWGDQTFIIGAFAGWLYTSVTTRGTSAQLFSGGTIRPGVWTHVALTYDGSLLSIYVNGVLAGSKPASGLPRLDDPSTPVYLGGRINGSANPGPPDALARGSVDPARVYDRVLSADEIRAQFAAGH